MKILIFSTFHHLMQIFNTHPSKSGEGNSNYRNRNTRAGDQLFFAVTHHIGNVQNFKTVLRATYTSQARNVQRVAKSLRELYFSERYCYSKFRRCCKNRRIKLCGILLLKCYLILLDGRSYQNF